MEFFSIILLLILSYLSESYCGSFYYYAYGSNLSGTRLKINSPSSEFYDIAILKNHRLDFNVYSDTWNGAIATIVPDPDVEVVGALWRIDEKHMPNLDEQELIDDGLYFPKNVTVTTLDGQNIVARTYEQTANPPKKRPCDDLPYERRPSNTYLEVILFGALQLGFPSDYIGDLISIPTNGKNAPDAFRRQLGYPFGPKKSETSSVTKIL